MHRFQLVVEKNPVGRSCYYVKRFLMSMPQTYSLLHWLGALTEDSLCFSAAVSNDS